MANVSDLLQSIEKVPSTLPKYPVRDCLLMMITLEIGKSISSLIVPLIVMRFCNESTCASASTARRAIVKTNEILKSLLKL